MQLRNKKTGEIIEFDAILPVKDVSGDSVAHLEYDSLAELNEEWEDVPEEPKEYWYIDDCGDIMIDEVLSSVINLRKSIGNYFGTLEEAKKAREKLKAVKRLKDYNVKFNLDFVKNKIDFTYSINNLLLDVLDGEEQIFNNMKIIFGGEE